MTTTNTITMTNLRRALRARFGSRQYRIAADGQVSAYLTPMTNTNQDGWAHIGWLSELLASGYERRIIGLIGC